ncbi:M23 family metallopeptidase [Thalassobacillus sp. CUG 92003]|uniref:M23 family metallopeptidase n=1 Tax=Thalassobacillus sp. CUG 92003 TaxID=2736641 RepID=UPI0015E78902|nr:M23 family metallopeptidase [Thalassobacillus sp. CUG 92003]
MREEEKKGVTKLKFRRLLRKKWMYPAIYLSVAVIVLAGVLWYQQSTNQVAEDLAEKPESEVEDEFVLDDSQRDEEAVPVMESEEELQMPLADDEEATIVTKFYDYEGSSEDQENALVLYNNKYYQSKGVDITKGDDQSFDVTAAASGTVTEVKEDPMYGQVITLSHDQDVTTVYASLDQVDVEAGTEVVQGDLLGTAGQNYFGQASGVHVHFEVRKEGEALNPESFFGKPLADLETPDLEEGASDEEEQPAPSEPGSESDSEEGSESGSDSDVVDPSEGEEIEEGTEETPSNENEDPINEDSESSISTTQT